MCLQLKYLQMQGLQNSPESLSQSNTSAAWPGRRTIQHFAPATTAHLHTEASTRMPTAVLELETTFVITNRENGFKNYGTAEK